jgi:hypothetical protein
VAVLANEDGAPFSRTARRSPRHGSTRPSAACSRSTRRPTSADRTPVTEDYKVPFAFNGVIDKVTITLGETPEAERAASDAIRQENRAKRILGD